MMMTADVVAQVLEGGMLACFGFAWPVDIYKTLRTRQASGKSVGFMGLIFFGYVSGLVAKFTRAAAGGGWPEAVTALYVVNAVLVAVDIALYYRYRRARGAA